MRAVSVLWAGKCVRVGGFACVRARVGVGGSFLLGGHRSLFCRQSPRCCPGKFLRRKITVHSHKRAVTVAGEASECFSLPPSFRKEEEKWLDLLFSGCFSASRRIEFRVKVVSSQIKSDRNSSRFNPTHLSRKDALVGDLDAICTLNLLFLASNRQKK